MKQFLLNPLRKPTSQPTPPRPGLVQRSCSPPEAWLRGEECQPGSRLSNAYEQSVWVYRAINVLAEQVANVPFLFSAGERGREHLITSGPLLDFYNRPHRQLNRFQYWELRIMWLMLRGECFRVPIFASGRTGQGASRRPLAGVLMLDPARFQHVVVDHQLVGWRYTGLGPRAPLASQVFLPEEVWFEKLPNPFDFWRGLPPLQVADLAVRTDYAAGAFMRGIIENNADPGVIVRTQEWLSPEQEEQIVEALQKRKRWVGVADRPVLLPGSLEVVRPHLSSTDLQFLDNRKFSRAEICAAFGVPEEIVATTDSAKYDVMAGARLNFIENRIAPLCSRLEAEEDVTVKAIDPHASGWFDLDSLPIMQETRRNRLVAARAGFEMGVPFNELNRVLDLGFKPLPWGDQGFVSGKVRPIERAPAQAAGESAVAEPSEAVAMESICSGEAEPSDPLARAQELFGRLRSVPAPAFQAALSSKLRRFFFEQRQRVLGRLAAAGQGGGGPAAPLVDLADENARLSAVLGAQLQAVAASQPEPPDETAFRQYLASRQSGWQRVNESTVDALAAVTDPEALAVHARAHFNDLASRCAGEIAQAELVALNGFLNRNLQPAI